MQNFLDLIGKSGAAYRFVVGEGRLSPAGGNFVLTRPKADGQWDLVRMGEDECLAEGAAAARSAAVAEHGADVRLFVRLNISRSTRHEELEDLLSAYGSRIGALETA